MKEFQEFELYLQEHNYDEEIAIPLIWNKYINHKDYKEMGNDIITVNKFSFFRSVLKSIRKLKDSPNNIIKDSQIYCAMPRYTTAWDLKNNNTISCGTLIRMLVLLPMLKKMGVDILYLLPITEYSKKYKKGDLGSPFAIKDFYKIDPNLHDDIVNEINNFTLDKEFKVLIQASHYLGIKIVIDFIPRVTARNSNIIKEHPEWFYWINKDYEKYFKTPEIDGLGFFEECTYENLEKVYSAETTKKHLSQFMLPPNELNPEKWSEILQKNESTHEDILDLIESEMNITTPPAHSDWINDVQPIWTDITFWKIYMDNNRWANEYLSKDQAPYVMFDTIKANKFPGKIPNQGLWDLFEDVLKYYTKEFKLDGFRFDIGHTLPQKLLKNLFSTVRKYNENPIFISEDLFNRNHENAFKAGYNIMLGSSWKEVSDIKKETYTNFINELKELKLMAYACAETHDTPRIVSRKGGINLSKSLAIVNNFLPNTTHFILSGYEVCEEQPMNCGLADNTDGRQVKKAFFNNITIDWNNYNAENMLDYLIKCGNLRREYRNIVTSQKFKMLDTKSNLIAFGYEDLEILVLFNSDSQECIKVDKENTGLNFENYMIEINSDISMEEKFNNLKEINLMPLQSLLLKKKC